MVKKERRFLLFPAYAGVIPAVIRVQPCMAAFPRTCGGDPLASMVV